ncbi:MAG TPA: methyltransferase domain-containing protein [Candidatus Paceibacterota bacterium]|nr:methyltransferase domain-containing protein [Candidatus Paceibacterota bacterium]HMO83153.1 methyltransferase domain-containing protein [Candidatus Paceibacterota bacterium]
MNFTLPGRFVIPEVVSTHFHLKEGDSVADFGAGNGFFLKILSAGVGQTGKVFACEIQKPLVEKLGEFIRLNSLPNVSPIWCDLEEQNGIKLPSDSLDAGILVNTLFQLEDKPAALAEMRRVLKRGGILHVIDWSESFGGLGPQAGDVITKEQATALCEAEQFIFERDYEAGDHHYGFAVRKL